MAAAAEGGGSAEGEMDQGTNHLGQMSHREGLDCGGEGERSTG